MSGCSYYYDLCVNANLQTTMPSYGRSYELTLALLNSFLVLGLKYFAMSK